MPRIRHPHRLVALLLAMLAWWAAAPLLAQSGRIENTATLRWVSPGGGAGHAVSSNTVAIELGRRMRPTSIGFRLPPPGRTMGGAHCDSMPALTLTPEDIDEATLAASAPLARLELKAPFIVVVDAEGENRDPQTREQIRLGVMAGAAATTMPLTETAPDSGVFAGGLPAVGMKNLPDVAACDLGLGPGEAFTLRFPGSDRSEPSEATALVDPAGYVFDSATGATVDGARVELIDLQGNPALVFGDDGISRYPSVVISGASVTDASGRVYPAEPGRYRFPFSPPGQYRLRVTPPGDYTAPSVVGPAALAALGRKVGRDFIINDASYGGVLTLVDVPVYADIPLDRPAAEALLLTKTATVREASPGDQIQYRLRLANRDRATASAITVEDVLPVGLRYARGSTRGAPEPVASSDGRRLTFALPPLPGGQAVEIAYRLSVNPGAPEGEALNRARATAPGLVSNEAAASVRLRPLLFSDALTVIGRVTEGDCGDPAAGRRGVAGIRLLTEDGTFVVTDRDGLYHLEGVRAGTHVVQLDPASIPASHQAVACDADTRQGGNPLSRFVEGQGGMVKRVDFQLRPTGRAAVADEALPVAIADDASAAGNRDWLAGQTPGIDWLFPRIDHNPRAPALRVVVKHAPGQRVALSVNGAAVEPIAFDGTDAAGVVAVSRWTGIPLVPGDNRLKARVLAADGTTVATLERTVHFAGAPVTAIVDQQASRLVADGLRTPLIAVRLRDAAGRPVRAGTPVPFQVDQPHFARIDPTRRTVAPGRVVGDNGLAFLPLQPTTQAGAVRLHVTLADQRTARTVDLTAWLEAPRRDWVVVGFGKGTAGYETLRRHGRAMPVAARDRVVTDGQLAFYAKGRIKGSWLLTMAYDTDRRVDRRRGLTGTIDPDRYYTVYGDGSDQRYDAATRRKLYLRLERKQFYALFGDIETGLTETRLTRYSRSLTGVKAAYEGRGVRATAIVADADTGYARDEIRGNGLSGPYRLSRRGIVANSDKLTIQVRDRFRPEIVKSEQAMARHIDYDIDIDLGTVRFREPVLSRTAGLDPVVIVVDYEVERTGGGRLAAAGHVAAKLAGGRVEVGAGAIRDDAENNATVAGLDLLWRAGAATELRAEVAAGGRQGLGRGMAWLAEIDHHGDGIDLSGYSRRQDVAFGVGQQNLVEAGTSRTGFDARVRLTPALTLTGTGWYQEQLDGPGRRIAGETRVEWRQGGTTLFAGAQVALDRGIDGGRRDSKLLTLGGSRALFGERLTLSGQTQFAPGGDKASVDFPVRHQATAAWRLAPGIRLIGGYEIAEGRDFRAHTAQAGFDVAPWTGAKLAATMNQQAAGENGQRLYAQYGLNQSLPLGPRWTVDASLDAVTTVRGRIDGAAAVNAFQASGQGVGSQGVGGQGFASAGNLLSTDAQNGRYAAVTLGAGYRGTHWTWNGRIERRDSDRGDRWGLTSNLLRPIGEGRTLASGIRGYRLTTADGRIADYASADVALAWRPLDSRWSVLERFELRRERADAGIGDGNVLGVPGRVAAAGGDQATTRAVNNLALNWRSGPEGLGHGVEATLYHGAKYVAGRFADDRFDGFIDMTGIEVRADLTRRVDLGLQATTSHAWKDGTWSFSAGPSVGVSPARDWWVTAGYNVAGYRDRDFEDDRYTRAGPYLTFRMKFDRAPFARRGQR